MAKPKVYGASKMTHRQFWKDLRESEPDIEWTAHWPDMECEDTPDLCKFFWTKDHVDIARSDFVLCYAGPGANDQLRGALIEAGIAIGLGKRVVIIDEYRYTAGIYGTWQYHPQVLRAESLKQALWMMKALTKEEFDQPKITTFEEAQQAMERTKLRRPLTQDELDDEIPF